MLIDINLMAKSRKPLDGTGSHSILKHYHGVMLSIKHSTARWYIVNFDFCRIVLVTQASETANKQAG